MRTSQRLLAHFRLYAACAAFLFSVAALAQVAPAATESSARHGLQLQSRSVPKLTVFNFGTEFVQTATEGRSITGFGPRVGFEYTMSEKVSVSASITFALQASGKMGAYFYSGFSGAFRYTFSGTNFREHMIVSNGGKSIIDFERVSRSRWQGAFGIEQLFLNGSTNIYPAVGFFGQVLRGIQMFGQDFETDLRIAQLQANDKPFTLIGAGLSMSFDF